MTNLTGATEPGVTTRAVLENQSLVTTSTSVHKRPRTNVGDTTTSPDWKLLPILADNFHHDTTWQFLIQAVWQIGKMTNWKVLNSPNKKRLTHHQVTPSKERPSSYVGNGESSLITAKNRYCKQIRQHFSGLMNLIRPNKSETKAVRELSIGNPKQEDNRDGQSSYVSTNRIAMSAPRCSFQVTNAEENPRMFQQFSTRSNHVVHLRNRPTEEQTSQISVGSLVLIGTRTSTLQPRSPDTNYTADQNLNARQSETVPRKLRRYVRSKTDSELLWRFKFSWNTCQLPLGIIFRNWT